MATLLSSQFTSGNDTRSAGDGWMVTSSVNTQSGTDTIIGSAPVGLPALFVGVDVFASGAINGSATSQLVIQGSGATAGIRNRGVITGGVGGDVIQGQAQGTYGIWNIGAINTGGGNDQITGSGKGIFNSGTIDMGAGNDTLTSQGTGFRGANTGVVRMGEGNDLISGFTVGRPAIRFDGGAGTDRLVVPAGTYTTGALDSQGFMVLQDPAGINQMLISGMDLIGRQASGPFQALAPSSTYVIN
jgi:hypothetical protein